MRNSTSVNSTKKKCEILFMANFGLELKKGDFLVNNMRRKLLSSISSKIVLHQSKKESNSIKLKFWLNYYASCL